MRPRGTSLRYLAMGLVGLVLAGCTGSGVNTQPPTSVTVTTAVSPTPTLDPRVQAAIDAYSAFIDASVNAQRHPVAEGQRYPSGADFTKFSFDPLRAQVKAYIWTLQANGTTFRGTPPTVHVKVKSVALQASSWPTVTVTDCETGSDWHGYDKSGKRLAEAKPKVPLPYLATATVIYYQDHWGVRTTELDSTRTCSP